MTIFKTLGEDFLKLTLSEQEYKKLIAREGRAPAPITMNMKAAMGKHKVGVVVASGNSGHVYVPREWIGKKVCVSLVIDA